MSGGSCECCRFFVKHDPQHVYGDCHRSPPQFGFYANIYEDSGYGGKQRSRIDITRERGGVWPNISQLDWCGEFRPIANDLGDIDVRQLGERVET